MKRTLLPLNALRVFDAAARHLSFTKAADELAVTPAAVGQQIRTLEDVLGTVLFRRMTRNLELTDEAVRSLPALREGFAKLEEAVAIMQAGQGEERLTIAAPRDFIGKWLAPRLGLIKASTTARQVTILPTEGPVDFNAANLDAAIFFGAMPAEEELSGKLIAPGTTVLVAAPEIAANVKIVSEVAAQPLIEHPSADWRGWFEAHGVHMTDRSASLGVADAGLAIDSAVAGYGIARVPLVLADADIAAGKLAVVMEPKLSDEAYWLIAPSAQWRQKKVRDLVAALSEA
ncbi:LysR family transcriptional regulator [Sphingosinicella sp.]|jgi:LysR family glycine cleavage system transcriptional activator|uniref:LysR family transcriptional regulator n=1 Tax=Sphingosinicella sp. TaxID=1917971 RepID=UPI001852DE69|nr:LysR family transcriptional regulator [Sphingosinicella sp.]MBA4757696.1 LysR family transcriptional regulator [Sphingosinicella sp.]MEA3538296.1 LysR substrate-binding domain-containing protein [Pseudomonadota bacterium]